MPTGLVTRRLVPWFFAALVAGCRSIAPAEPPHEPPKDARMLPPFDPAAQAEGRPTAGRSTPLKVRDTWPRGPSDGDAVRLRFDRLVVDRTDPPADARLVIERVAADGTAIEVPSSSRWPRGDTLVAVPAAPLEPAHTYRVRLVGGAALVDGGIDASWSFETPRPELSLAESWSFSYRGRTPIVLVPTQPIAPKDLAARLRVTARPMPDEHRAEADGPAPPVPPGKRVVVRVRRATADDLGDEPLPKDALAIEPTSAWPASSQLELAVSPVHGALGPLAMAREWVGVVETADTLSIGPIECDGQRDGRCPVGPVVLPTRVEVDNLRAIEVRPRVAGLTLTHGSTSSGDHAVVVDGEWKPGRRYTIVAPAKLRDVDGARLGKTRRAAFVVDDGLFAGHVDLEMSPRRGIFGDPADARIGVRGRGVDEVEVRLAVLSAADAAALQRGELDSAPWPEGAREHTLRMRPGSGAWPDTVEVDLAKHVARGEVVLVEARATTLDPRADPDDAPPPVRGLFSLSSLGVSVHRGPTMGFVRVTDLETGEPVGGAEVALVRDHEVVVRRRSDADGLARLPAVELEPARVDVLVTSGDDALGMPLRAHPWLAADAVRRGKMTTSGRLALKPLGSARTRHPTLRPGEVVALSVHVGRAVFLPGDRVDFAGWATISTPHEAIATRRVPPGTEVTVEVRRDGATVVARAKARIDEHGRFSGHTRVPSFAALGDYDVVVRALAHEGETRFVVTEARIPSFEIEATPRVENLLRGEDVVVDFAGRLLSGQATALDSARVSLACRGDWPRTMRHLPEGFDVHTDDAASDANHVFHLDRVDDGRFSITQSTEAFDHRRPMYCAVDVAAVDLRLQEVGTSASVRVDPAPEFLAIALPQQAVVGRAAIRVIVVDAEGRRVDRRGVEVSISKIEDDGRRLREGEGRPGAFGRCTLDASATGAPAVCRTSRLGAGEYRVHARADIDGRPIELATHLRVSEPREDDADAAEPPTTSVAPAAPRETPFEIESPTSVEPGDVVPIVVRGPWSRARGVLAVEQTGLREVIPFEMRDGVARVRTKARAARGPTLELHARVTPRIDTGRFATEVVTTTATDVAHLGDLRVSVAKPPQARPGDRVQISITVTDEQGPVDARLAVWVVDEGVHQLRSPHLRLDRFFDADRRGERQVDRSFDSIVAPFDGWWGRRIGAAPRIRQASGNVSGAADVAIGRRFDPAPLFVGNVGTGADGKVELPLELPDDLTRFRIEAIASAPARGHPEGGPVRFGVDHETIVVSSPLQLRAALPRGLRQGDEATIAAVVNVPVAGELEAELELVGKDGAITSVGATRRTIAVTPGTRRVEFAVSATKVGTSTVRLRGTLRRPGTSKPIVAGVEQAVRVAVDRTQREVAAHHGSVDDDTPIEIPVVLPKRAVAGHGGIAVHTSATTIGELEPATEYLESYPYECLEQTASRLVPIVALASLPDGWKSRDHAVSKAAELVAKIASMQRADGRLTYWPGGRDVDPFASAYALWILQLAKARGVDVDARLLERAAGGVREGLADAHRDRGDGDVASWVEQAVALHALSLSGELELGVFDRLWAERTKLPPFARIMLLLALHHGAPTDIRVAELREDLSALIEERQGVAHVAEPIARLDRAFDSGARDDALALMALLEIAPDDPRIDKLARGLRERRRDGRWRTTQENAFALLALSDYARLRERDVPRHHVEGWIGDARVVDADVRDRSTTTRVGRLGLAAASRAAGADGAVDVIVGRKGAGRVHYRVDVEWSEPDPPARAQGLELRRRIVDEDGMPVDTLRAGQRYRLEVELETDALQHHIAVELPLPLGLEPVDASLGSGVAARVVNGPRSPELSHAELRTDRVLLFFDALPGGRHVHSVPVFAVTPGKFVMPPGVAEAMYEPETRARTRRAVVEIEGRAQD